MVTQAMLSGWIAMYAGKHLTMNNVSQCKQAMCVIAAYNYYVTMALHMLETYLFPLNYSYVTMALHMLETSH